MGQRDKSVATIAVLGLLGITGNIILPEQLLILQDPLVIGAALLMYVVEFFADKTPGVDTGWDTIHTFIRIPAGVMLAAGAVGNVNPALVVAAGILGGTVAGTTHMIKAGSRVLINSSPEPFTNWAASIIEDVAVIGTLFTALHFPAAFLLLFVVFMVLAAWFMPRLWRGICYLAGKIRQIFASDPDLQKPPVQGEADPPVTIPPG
jgi:hypothetical protein